MSPKFCFETPSDCWETCNNHIRILLAEPCTAVTEAIFAGRPYNATYRI